MIEQVGALGAVEEDRLAADAAERPGGAVDPAGHELFRPLEGKMALFVRHDGPVGHQDRGFSNFRRRRDGESSQ